MPQNQLTPKLHMMLPVESRTLDKDFIKRIERGEFIVGYSKEE